MSDVTDSKRTVRNKSNEGIGKLEDKAKAIMILIILTAVVASVASYLYSSYTAGVLESSAIKDIRASATIQANDVGKILGNKAESIKSNLVILATSKRVQDRDLSTPPGFSAIQESTKEFTDSYLWLDADGKLLWSSSFSNDTLRQQYFGADRSDREYFLTPKETLNFHITSAIESVDGTPRLFFSYPVTDQISNNNNSTNFKGVIVASANLINVGHFLKSQLTPDSQNQVGLVGKEGTILYAPNESSIGLNVSSEEYLSATLPEQFRSNFTTIITKSLSSDGPGYGDMGSQTSSATLAYQPVVVDGSKFAILYVVAPHNLADNIKGLLDNERLFTLVLVIAIAGISAGSAVAIARWNGGLAALVAKRTAELEAKTRQLEIKTVELENANESLETANDKLKVHDRLQKEFVNVAAHELRTPIQPLLAAAEIMESQFDGKEVIEVTRPEVEMIVRNALRLERLSSDILEISRIESGALKLNRETFSLSYIVADAVKDAKIRSVYDADKVKISYRADDIFVDADREKITQVIANLLTNAMKFTKAGSITITTKRDQEKNVALVTVKDTGQGIDPSIMPKLFTKFVTRSDKGTGIGLYISKNIIDAHGGKIFGENNPDGVGASFSFTLPLEKSSSRAEAEPSSAIS